MNNEYDFNKVIEFGILVNDFINLNKSHKYCDENHECCELLKKKYMKNVSSSIFHYIKGEKNKRHVMNIRSIQDALMICALLEQPNSIDYYSISHELSDLFYLFKDDFPFYENIDNSSNIINRHIHSYMYKDILLPWITKKNNMVKNPNTGRSIKVGSGTYKKLFRSIKLVENRAD